MVRGGPAGRWIALALVSVLLLTASVPVDGARADALADVGQIDPDVVRMSVALQPNGDADWEIRYLVELADENDTAAFESLEGDIRENRSEYADRFGGRMERTVAASENATGRDMAVRNVSVGTARQEIPRSYGVLVYSFEWEGFARANETTVVAGDAVGGLFLDGATSLTIDWPSGYAAVTVDPPADETAERSATWRGPTEFSAEQPRLVVSTDAPAESDPGPGGSGTGGGSDVAMIAAAGLLGLALLFAGAWWWRRSLADTAGAGTAAGDEPASELLSNEERVLQLLEAHGGRMKQQQVVEELDWTDAKTSQVVGELRESGEIEGFRLGRENVLRLPEADERSET